MKIGIFGGCFNPPHYMHKQIALDLISKGYLDKVIYVPTGNRYNKKDLASVKDRYNMLKIMTKDNKYLLVSHFEVKNELVYTYQTLDYFRKKYPHDEIYFICGSDNLKEFKTWKRYKYILNNYKILVVSRNGLGSNLIDRYDNANIILTNIKESNLSSTDIRKSIKEDSYNCLVEVEVLEYIKKNRLYVG